MNSWNFKHGFSRVIWQVLLLFPAYNTPTHPIVTPFLVLSPLVKYILPRQDSCSSRSPAAGSTVTSHPPWEGNFVYLPPALTNHIWCSRKASFMVPIPAIIGNSFSGSNILSLQWQWNMLWVFSLSEKFGTGVRWSSYGGRDLNSYSWMASPLQFSVSDHQFLP